MYTRVTPILSFWQAVGYIIVISACVGVEVWAATVSTYAFGRYEIVLQEGTPFAGNEIFGMVRRQSGLPEYPLMLGSTHNQLELNILGPGNRPIQLATTKSAAPAGARMATTTFRIARSAREGETLQVWVQRAKAPGQVVFAVDLQALERRLEGQR